MSVGSPTGFSEASPPVSPGKAPKPKSEYAVPSAGTMASSPFPLSPPTPKRAPSQDQPILPHLLTMGNVNIKSIRQITCGARHVVCITGELELISFCFLFTCLIVSLPFVDRGALNSFYGNEDSPSPGMLHSYRREPSDSELQGKLRGRSDAPSSPDVESNKSPDKIDYVSDNEPSKQQGTLSPTTDLFSLSRVKQVACGHDYTLVLAGKNLL